MTIEELKTLQREENGGSLHIVWIGEDGWACAHTDDERYLAENFPAALPLEDCPINEWLDGHIHQPAPTGIYIALEEGDGWELIPYERRLG